MYAFFKSILIFWMLSSSVFAVEVDEVKFYKLTHQKIRYIHQFHEDFCDHEDMDACCYFIGLKDSLHTSIDIFQQCIIYDNP